MGTFGAATAGAGESAALMGGRVATLLGTVGRFSALGVAALAVYEAFKHWDEIGAVLTKFAQTPEVQKLMTDMGSLGTAAGKLLGDLDQITGKLAQKFGVGDGSGFITLLELTTRAADALAVSLTAVIDKIHSIVSGEPVTAATDAIQLGMSQATRKRVESVWNSVPVIGPRIRDAVLWADGLDKTPSSTVPHIVADRDKFVPLSASEIANRPNDHVDVGGAVTATIIIDPSKVNQAILSIPVQSLGRFGGSNFRTGAPAPALGNGTGGNR